MVEVLITFGWLPEDSEAELADGEADDLNGSEDLEKPELVVVEAEETVGPWSWEPVV